MRNSPGTRSTQTLWPAIMQKCSAKVRTSDNLTLDRLTEYGTDHFGRALPEGAGALGISKAAIRANYTPEKGSEDNEGVIIPWRRFLELSGVPTACLNCLDFNAMGEVHRPLWVRSVAPSLLIFPCCSQRVSAHLRMIRALCRDRYHTSKRATPEDMEDGTS